MSCMIIIFHSKASDFPFIIPYMLILQTDLKNTDYTLEAGATRLFEAEKLAQQMAEEERREKEAEELNPMKVSLNHLAS